MSDTTVHPPITNAARQTRVTCQARFDSQSAGFDILAITAGKGNGWEFSAACLQASLPLWQGAECFIDHNRQSPSIRDLAGVCHAPAWDEVSQGIRLSLKPCGPGAALLNELGALMTDSAQPHPSLGFSADLLFLADGRKVTEIVRVNSVDLVLDPARGGAFVRSLNQTLPTKKEGPQMTLPDTSNLLPEPSAEAPAPENQQVQQLRLCASLLESSLANSNLPPALQSRLRSEFSSRVFEPESLQLAIQQNRELVSQLSGRHAVQGVGQVQGMFSSEDHLQAAVDDLFGLPRERGLEQLKAARLSGIRELYLMLTGDHDLHGGYHPARVQLATTADFTGLVKNALNKIVSNTWEELGRAGYDWWKRVASVEHFTSLNSITGTLIGTVGALPSISEGTIYPELKIGDSPETASFIKYGGYIPLTLELIDRDETRKLRAYPRELAAAGLRKISALTAAIFTDNAGVGPTMADGAALFNADAVTAAGGHANLLTSALSASAWDTASSAIYSQPMLVKNDAANYGKGPKMAINPRYLLVPRALQLAAMKILYPSLENAANIYSENLQRGQPGDVITVPDWSDANDWAAACDPLLAPAIYIGERFGLMPEIFIAGNELSPAVFTHDEHRLKVRHFLAVWVNDYRPLLKSNVAA